MNSNFKLAVSLILVGVFGAPVAHAVDSCPSAVVASCASVTPDGTKGCVDVLANTVPLDQFKTSCEHDGSHYSTSPCDTANIVGNCVLGSPEHGNQDAIIMRLYSPLPADYVIVICNQAHGHVCQ